MAVIAFNYDIGVEFGLWAEGFDIDYCLDEVTSNNENAVDLLKLHGSINWTTCTRCDRVISDHIRDIVHRKDEAIRRTGADASPARLSVSSLLGELICCKSKCAPEPAIVPPTVEKGGLRAKFQPVWRRASAHLKTADNIFVIGYSWPEGDQCFHQLYALGTVGDRFLRRFWVCNPDEAVVENVRARLLGQSAVDRLNYRDQSRNRNLVARDFRSAIDVIGWELLGADMSAPSRRTR